MKNRQTRSKKIAFLGLSAALALLLSYVEFLLPPIYAAVPGIKLGLPNVVILFVLYSFSFKYAALVSFVRLCVSSLLFGNMMTFVYSFAGALLSLVIMGMLKRSKLLSSVGVSVAGGISHNLGQILVAAMLLDTPGITGYMIILTLTGTLSGIFIGLCGAFLIKRIPKEKFF
ncbi:MAG: Gx transporter family protein [Ruminococcaceae bacterium]|nr:Gx transporter family protein [Oscillospiraceae bacterium]